ncbi:MAG: complex I NDUFA9 subunit family protein [Burkholderiaceae bacterium]
MQRILVLGGTGFVGQRICARLASRNLALIVPTRRRRNGRDLMLLPAIDVLEADIHDDHALARLVGRADAVINLVGVLHSPPGEPWGPAFDRAHVQLPTRVAAECARQDRRLIHVSALGVNPQSDQLPSAYLRSKAAGEAAIAASGLKAYTIFRPSVIFGPGDSFLNLFATLQRWLPVMALGRANAQFQPVYVGDVAEAVNNVLDNPATWGKTYELAGPEIYSLRELVRLAGEISGHVRPIIALPDGLGALQARLLEKMPGPTLMSMDNFDSMAKPNIATGPMAEVLGMKGTTIGSVAPGYLRAQDARFALERAHARR